MFRGHALIPTELDYFSLFYIGLSLNSKWKLQLIQNLELGKFAIVELYLFLDLQATNTLHIQFKCAGCGYF